MSVNIGMDKGVVHVCNEILLSCKKRNDRVQFAKTWMDLQTVILTEVSEQEENKCILMLTHRI